MWVVAKIQNKKNVRSYSQKDFAERVDFLT